MDRQFSALEKSIPMAKGLTAEQLEALNAAGVGSRDDLKTVGDADTLVELASDIAPATAVKVMDWAIGRVAPQPTAHGTGSRSRECGPR